MNTRLRNLFSWRPGKLAMGTLAMTAGLGLRTVGQGVVFLIVARVLGVEAYGAYSAVLALAMAFSWFAGLGASGIMLRDTARDAEAFAESWGRTLAALFITAPTLLAIYLVLAWAILPRQISWMVVVCLGAAEILFAPLTLASVQAYQGNERIGRAAHIQIVPVLPRMLAALALLLLALVLPTSARLPAWAFAYLFAATVAASYAFWRLRCDFALSFGLRWQGLASTLRQGWPYSVSSASGKIYMDIDKLMLARLTSLDATGVYSAAYRVVDMAGVPLMSFLAAASPRFFRAGQGGVHGSARYALRVLPFPMAYAAGVGLVLFMLAGLLPWLLGDQFAPAADALRWLAWLPLVYLPRGLMQYVLIGADRQRLSAGTLVVGAAVNLILNLYAIPRWGWQGAAAATYASEFCMVVLMLGIMLRHAHGTTS